MSDPNVTNNGQEKLQEFVDKDELIGEGVLDVSDFFKDDDRLSMSDYYDSSIPYEVKPVPYLKPMEELDFPTQAKDLFGGLFQETPKSQLKLSPLIKESDGFDYRGMTYDWSTDGVAIYLQFEKNNTYVASTFESYNESKFTPHIYSNNKTVEKSLNDAYDEGQITDVTLDTHSDLYELILELFPNTSDHILQGRLFQIKSQKYPYVMGFWNEPREIRKFLKPISEFLKRLRIDPTKILWTYSGGERVVKYETLFKKAHTQSKRSKEQIEMLRNIHLNAIVKRKVLNLPPHPFQLLADKLGVTVIQLRQLAGSSIDEQISPGILLETMERGEGFWLSPKGVFHNVDEELGAHGHLDWAKKKFGRSMSYEEVLELGYIWVGIMEDTKSVNFMYHERPSETQMYLLKKEAVTAGLKLYDIKKKEIIDTQLLKEASLVNESDRIWYQGNKYYYDKHGVSVVLVWSNNMWVSSTFMEPFKLGFDSNKDKLADVMDKNYKEIGSRVVDTGYGYPYNHPDVEDYMKVLGVKASGHDPELRGRLFDTHGAVKDYRYILSFWEPKLKVQRYKLTVFDYLKSLKLDPKEILWGSDGGNSSAETFEEFFGSSSGKESITPQQRALMRLQHLDARAKRKLIKLPPNRIQKLADSMGITVVELRSRLGSMDEAENARDPGNPNGRNYDWDDPHHVGVFVVWDSSLYAASESHKIGRNTGKSKFFCSDKDVERQMNIGMDLYNQQKFIDMPIVTHGRLGSAVAYSSKEINKYNKNIGGWENAYPFMDENHGQVAGRAWQFRDRFVVGFWESVERIRQYWPQILECLKFLKVDPTKAVYTFNDEFKDQYPYEYVIGKEKTKEPDTKELLLRNIMHLSADAKRELLKNYPPNALQTLADNMGIPLVQLKSLLGRMDESADFIRIKDPISGTSLSADECDESVFAVFCLGEFYGDRGYVYWDRASGDIVHDGGSDFDIGPNQKCLTHGSLLQYLLGDEDSYGDEEDEREDPYKRGVHGRAFKIKGQFYIAFWETKDTIQHWRKELEACLKELGIDYFSALYQTGRMATDEFINYREMMSSAAEKAQRSADDVNRAQQLHLLPPEQKGKLLKAIGAAGIHKQQELADKLGMTVVQLRQALGRTDEVFSPEHNIKAYWLDKDGKALLVRDHTPYARTISGEHIFDDQALNYMYQHGWARITLDRDAMYVNTSLQTPEVKLSKAQKDWLSEMKRTNHYHILDLQRHSLDID